MPPIKTVGQSQNSPLKTFNNNQIRERVNKFYKIILEIVEIFQKSKNLNSEGYKSYKNYFEELSERIKCFTKERDQFEKIIGEQMIKKFQDLTGSIDKMIKQSEPLIKQSEKEERMINEFMQSLSHKYR